MDKKIITILRSNSLPIWTYKKKIPYTNFIYIHALHFKKNQAFSLREWIKKLNFLYLNQNICCGYSKEPSQWDGSFEQPKHMLICLLDLILYVPVNNLSVMSGWVFLGWTRTKLGLMCLAQGHNTATLVTLVPTALRSRVKHSTTEPLRFPEHMLKLMGKKIFTILHLRFCLFWPLHKEAINAEIGFISLNIDPSPLRAIAANEQCIICTLNVSLDNLLRCLTNFIANSRSW